LSFANLFVPSGEDALVFSLHRTVRRLYVRDSFLSSAGKRACPLRGRAVIQWPPHNPERSNAVQAFLSLPPRLPVVDRLCVGLRVNARVGCRHRGIPSWIRVFGTHSRPHVPGRASPEDASGHSGPRASRDPDQAGSGASSLPDGQGIGHDAGLYRGGSAFLDAARRRRAGAGRFRSAGRVSSDSAGSRP
jgi:hypothetical protein